MHAAENGTKTKTGPIGSYRQSKELREKSVGSSEVLGEFIEDPTNASRIGIIFLVDLATGQHASSLATVSKPQYAYFERVLGVYKIEPKFCLHLSQRAQLVFACR